VALAAIIGAMTDHELGRKNNPFMVNKEGRDVRFYPSPNSL
jgi:hypothetical protein